MEQLLNSQYADSPTPHEGRPTRITYVEPPEDERECRHSWFPSHLQNIILLKAWNTYTKQLRSLSNRNQQTSAPGAVPIFGTFMVAALVATFLFQVNLFASAIFGLMGAMIVFLIFRVVLGRLFVQNEKVFREQLLKACPNLVSFDVEFHRDTDSVSHMIWVVRYYSDAAEAPATDPVVGPGNVIDTPEAQIEAVLPVDQPSDDIPIVSAKPVP